MDVRGIRCGAGQLPQTGLCYGVGGRSLVDPLPEFLPGGLFTGRESIGEVAALVPDQPEMFVEMPVGGIGRQPLFDQPGLFGTGLFQQVFYQQVVMDGMQMFIQER